MSRTIVDFHVHPFDNMDYSLNMYPDVYPLDGGGMENSFGAAGIPIFAEASQHKVQGAEFRGSEEAEPGGVKA